MPVAITTPSAGDFVFWARLARNGSSWRGGVTCHAARLKAARLHATSMGHCRLCRRPAGPGRGGDATVCTSAATRQALALAGSHIAINEVSAVTRTVAPTVTVTVPTPMVAGFKTASTLNGPR